jgi:hypothetical protein
MVDKLSDLVLDNTDANIKNVGGHPYYDIFNDGRTLFEVFSSDPELLRGVEIDFGYLPYPKYDENQEDYITLCFGGLMSVPISKTPEELEIIGVVTEALSAASNKYVADAFVKQYIENKILRDEDSVNMYRLMRRTSTYDRAMFYDTTNQLSNDQPYYTAAIMKRGLTSEYEKSADKIQNALDDFYESVLSNE